MPRNSQFEANIAALVRASGVAPPRRGRGACGALAAGVALVVGSALGGPLAHAAEPSPAPSSSAGAQHDRAKTEFAALPVVGGDSDVGIGGGVITSLARVRPDLDPYLWRLEAVGMTTVKVIDDQYDVRYADVSLALTLPHVIKDRLGLTARASYTRETDLSYYGMGNAADVGGHDENDPYYSFDWTHPQLEIKAELKLHGDFELVGGASYGRSQIRAPADGKLVEDAQSSNANLRHLTRIVPEHDVATLSLGVNWDARDDEVDPEHGHYHSLRFDLSPSIGGRVPYSWLRANLALRQYVRLWPGRLVGAVRVLADALAGQPPFYELARFDGSFAIGGTRGMRGLPAPGYYGMLKLLGNFELRARLFSFELLDKRYQLGAVAFSDLGRVFADYGKLSELDGTGLGLKVAFGAGLRLRAGKSFVLRTDVAGSPGEGSTGAYLTAGQLF